MDGIADILAHKDFDIPPEVAALKAYIRRYYKKEVSVTMSQRNLLISAPSSGLIATLRLNVTKLQTVANTDKKIVFRIG